MKLLLKVLALDRRSYEIRSAFTARVIEWIAKIGKVRIVYGLEYLQSMYQHGSARCDSCSLDIQF